MRITALAASLALGISVLGFGGTVANAATPPNKEIKPSTVTVTVESGDTLTAIAEEKKSTVERIYSANTVVEHPDLIHPGEKLRIPNAEEKLKMREMPVAVTAPAPVVAAAPSTPTPTPTPAPAVAPVPAPQPSRVSAPAVAGGSVWDQIAQCESGGNWAINTGNGYYGGIQFSLSSWQAVGGSGLPSDASREEQIMRGQKLQAIQGWGAWPACSAKLGLL